MIAQRVEKLKMKMEKLGVKAYLIPSSDAHQSEYVPALWQRRPWISGFTGSAGDVVISTGACGLWTDGRYFVQAEQQLKGSGIDLFRMGNSGVPSIEEFLSTELNSGDAVGIDPKTVSHTRAVQLVKDLRQNGINIKFMDDNLIDDLWEDQPDFPAEAIFVHPLKYAGESVESKLKRLRAEMSQKGVQAHVLSMLDAIAWFFNIRSNDVDYNPVAIAYAIITADAAQLFVKKSKVGTDVIQHLEGLAVIREYDEFGMSLDALAAEGKRVWLDMAATNHWIVGKFINQCPVYDATSPVTKFKAIKNKAELAGWRACHIRDGVAMVNFLHWLDNSVVHGGVTEISASDKLEEFRKQQDMFMGLSFASISSYKIHGAIIHYSATPESDIPLEAEGIYLIDSGGQYLDGTTDITRTIQLGPVTDESRVHFTKVLQGHINLALTSFPEGTKGPALDTIARKPLWDIGLNYNHGTGHGVGAFLGVHEGPQSINPTRAFTVALEKGMICSNEPGYYKDGAYGIRIENLITVVDDDEKSTDEFKFLKFETATVCPIDTRLLDRHLLDAAQVEWLNQYHAFVWEKLSPLVDGDVKNWLKNAVKPI